ncbi:predicted protein [Naegleria gruberi]|uniref:Predicted protein n=1 Tax=Naegleria gruberi TaxID=5762 RepID=D2V8Y2_NAEGR|nr:uncharacterized protein NAEGRDRAFT_47614 [Naegleria gruberi]EFC46882.1 predicted protein [Naegleria gruberi]|eukprot:XP_002679626.1 predicted protein [Naegleria gruberi strain NEG-M]
MSDGFIVLPTALIVKDPCKKSDNSLEGLLDQSGQHGCSTQYVMKPNVELKFDRIYQFTTLECVSNKKYPDDQQRLRGVDVSVRSNETDPWKAVCSFKEGNGIQLINLNVAARFIKFDRFGKGEVAFGRLWVRASDALPVNIKTKAGEIIQVSNVQESAVVDNLDEPQYTEGEISVIAPTKLVLSSKDTWGNNTIEGLLDETGKYGVCTQNGSKQNVVLTFNRVYLFTLLEFKACRLGENNQFGLLENTQIEYKQLESQEWIPLREIKKSDIKKHPESNYIHFDTPVKARAFKFSKLGNGFVQLFIGMLKLFGYHPYTDIKTVSGVVSRYNAQSGTTSVPVVVQATPIVTSQPTTSQPVVQPVVSQPVVATPKPQVAQPVVQQTPVTTTQPKPQTTQPVIAQQPQTSQPIVVSSDEPKFTSGEINCVPPLELKQSSKDTWGDNSLQGLFDDSGKLGACTARGSNNYIEIKYGAVYLFTYLEYKSSKLGDNMQLDCLQNVRIEYRVKESDSWTIYGHIKRSDIKLRPQVNTIEFTTPIKARYWRFCKEDNENLFFGMIRLYGYCDYVPIQTKGGVILSVKEALAQWEPKFTGPEVNLIPIKELISKGESRRENTVEGLLDDSGDYGYTTASHQKEIELEFEHVYLLTHVEYMTLSLSNDPVFYLKGTKIESKVKDSDPWTLVSTIEKDSIQLGPLVNTITFTEPIKAKRLRLVAADSCLEIGMFRPFGYAPFVAVKTKSGPLLSKEEYAKFLEDPYPGCQEINLIKPVSLYRNTSNARQKADPKAIEDLSKPDGKEGFSTSSGTSSFIEMAFDRVYNFRVMTFRNHEKSDQYEKKDGTGRYQTCSLIDTLVEYKLTNRDNWLTYRKVYSLTTSVKGVFMLDFGEVGLKAKHIRFVQKPHQGMTGTLAAGMMRFYAFAPAQQVKIGSELHKEIKVELSRKENPQVTKLSPSNLVDPIYTESTCPDVNVVAPIKILTSQNSNKANNSIEGILDDNGKYGTSIAQSVHNYLILEFEAVFQFKYFEFMKHEKIQFSDELKTSLVLYSKVNENDLWTRVRPLSGNFYHWPKLNIIKFDGEGINARFFKFERVCGDFSFGMIQFFAVAPFVPYNSLNGVILSREQQEAPHLTPYKGNQVNCLVPDEIYVGLDEDEVLGNKQPSSLETEQRAENTIAGLLDDSAEYGICSEYGTLIIGYNKIQFFKYIEYYTHALYDEKNQKKFASDIQVYYKIRLNEPWIPFGKNMEQSKVYPNLNRFELSDSSTGFKAKYWKFETRDVLLLGTFKLFGFGEFIAAPTVTGTLRPVNHDFATDKLNIKDLVALEKYYSKYVSEKFKPISEGMGPVKQLDNDLSKLVNPILAGTSQINIILPDSSTSTNIQTRSSFTPIYINIGKVEFELLNLRFVNPTNTTISVVSMKIEYLDHDKKWIPFTYAADVTYWQPALIKTFVKNKFTEEVEVVYKESTDQGEYVHLSNFNINPGETVNYNVNGKTICEGENPEYNNHATSLVPHYFPYPSTFKFSLVDSLGETKTVEVVYMHPELKEIQDPQKFKETAKLRDQDFFAEVSDNVNRINSFVGVRADPSGEGIILFNSAITKENESTKKFDLGQLRFGYENKKQEEQLLWDAKGKYCSAKFYLLSDPELHYRAFAIKVVANSLSKANHIERVYSIYEILQHLKPLAISNKE